MVLGESLGEGDGEIPQNFGSVRLVGGESLVAHRTVFSQDSKVLFCCCGRRIRVYSTSTGDLLRELKGHEGKVTGIKVNPRNHLQLVSCSLNGGVIYWDHTDGRILKKYKFGGTLLEGLIIHPVHNESVFLIKKKSLKAKIIRTKGDKKRKVPDPEEYSLCVFNPKECKKDKKPKLKVLLEVSGNSKQTTISGDGSLLATVKGENLHLWDFNSKKLNTFTYQHARFTCAAFHPLEACVAAGEGVGRIILWQGLDQLENPITMELHWHPNPVSDIVFSQDGSNMLSGGQEGVLVMWQYKTHHQEFLPRLGAPINHLAVSPDDSLTAVSQNENVIRLINNIEWKMKRAIQGLRQIDNLYTGIVFDPRSKALVTSNMPGVLQFYLPLTDHHAFSLDVVRQNFLSRTKREQIVCTKIDHVAFSDDGGWLATVERRDDKKNALELRLKFWEYNTRDQCYAPNTCVDPPHERKIVAIQFQPQQKKDSAVSPLAMTAGRDGKFKIWVLAEEGEKYSWSCRSVGYYGDTPCQDAAFSQDGSLLAVAYSQTITLWTPETNELRKTLALPYPEEEIKKIKFGNRSSSQYLVSITNQYLTVWNLLSCAVWWSIEAPVTCLASDPQTNLICVFVSFNKNKSHFYVFDPATPRPVAVQSNVSKKADVVSAAFDPGYLSCSSTKDHPIKMSKLYFLNHNQELFTLDFGELTDEESQAISRESIAGPHEEQAEFFKIFGQPTKSKGESTSEQSVGRSVKGTPSSAVVRQMLQTPAHVLPSVTSLCSSFLKSLLVSKQTSQRDDQVDDEADASESEDESMEEEEDSDLETTRVAAGTSEQPVVNSSVEMLDTDVSHSQGSHLDKVNFTWLQDYFASS